MIFYDLCGKCIELKRDDFYTDTDYYMAIVNAKYGAKLQKEAMTVNDLCGMI